MDASELAKSIARRSFIKNPDRPGVQPSGEAAAKIIDGYISRYSRGDGIRVLDFGSGSGRVVVPLAKMRQEAPFSATDVDRESVEYISLTAPKNVTTDVNPYQGPLLYLEGSHDVAYAVSVWSHLPQALGRYWLEEVRRVLKPNGFAVLTFAGAHVLGVWAKDLPTWRSVTSEDLDREKFIYREADPEKYPGIQSSWGNTAIHPEYIRREWG
jgi:SAM-dependent methyltransferase